MEKTKRLIARLVADVSPKDHLRIKTKAVAMGLTVQDVITRFLVAWVEGKIKLPQK